ncbi:MAG TPA: hypothetical protein VGE52_12810 [Pirellulales bacterium]
MNALDHLREFVKAAELPHKEWSRGCNGFALSIASGGVSMDFYFDGFGDLCMHGVDPTGGWEVESGDESEGGAL